ncbi:hypothetical protein [Paraburkholderia lycopersici]|uniref:hypothetical protein n=1 Tax=Paraburkholderia lycopersici TaxID=416944 RepID=UPI0011610A91|nr:hypothetical protein [Paraburkholderia lycopersici]
MANRWTLEILQRLVSRAKRAYQPAVKPARSQRTRGTRARSAPLKLIRAAALIDGEDFVRSRAYFEVALGYTGPSNYYGSTVAHGLIAPDDGRARELAKPRHQVRLLASKFARAFNIGQRATRRTRNCCFPAAHEKRAACVASGFSTIPR